MVAAVVAVAAFDVPSNAATVNGVGISRATLNSDLGVISATPTYQCYLAASLALRSQNLASLPAVGGSGLGQTVTTRFADLWLSTLVNNQLIEQLAAARHLRVNAAALAAGRADLVNSISGTLTAVAQAAGQPAVCAPDGSAVLRSLPADFADRLARAQAVGDVILADAAGYGLGAAQLSSFYAAHRSDFDVICLSAIATATLASANALRAEVEGGASFALVASANSTDAASAAQGGAIGCFAPTDSAYGSVTRDVAGLAVGGVSAPQSNAGSYVLLQVTARSPTSFRAAGDSVRQAVLVAGATAAGRELQRSTKRAAVAIDPRYGNWVGGTTISIRPPVNPPATSLITAGG